MNIPDGGKSELRKMLCAQPDKLFTYSTFDAAWKYLRQKDLIKMKNHQDYITSK
jgi:hypothetical protein